MPTQTVDAASLTFPAQCRFLKPEVRMYPDPACGLQVGANRQTYQDCVCVQESAYRTLPASSQSGQSQKAWKNSERIWCRLRRCHCLEGPEREQQGLGKLLTKERRRLEHVLVLIPLSIHCIAHRRSSWLLKRSSRLPAPSARWHKVKNSLIFLQCRRPILSAPVADESSPAEGSESAPGYQPTGNRLSAL